MGYFPIMLGFGAALFMWFALVSQSLKIKFQALIRTQNLKKQQETEVLENFEKLFSQLKMELGTDHEASTDLLILQNQSRTDSMDWYEEVAKELEKIVRQNLVNQILRKNIEVWLSLKDQYRKTLQNYQRAIFLYEELLTSGMARIPARILGYGKV